MSVSDTTQPADVRSAAFTPGPWQVEQVEYSQGLDTSFEVTAGGRVIAQTHMRVIKSEGKLIARDKANVDLIAAAPELLDALQMVWDAYGFDPSIDSSIWQTVQAAITKATGSR